MATATVTKSRIQGGSWLLEERHPEDVFTPEDFNEQHQLIAKTAEEFAENEIVPNIEKIEHKEFAVTRALLKKASEIGIANADVPEEYGGSEMDKISSAIIADRIAKCGSFSTSFGGHAGIGTLPILYFGTEEQKKKYLPRLTSGEWVGAYALSESSSGSDALNAHCKATLSSDGRHYILNGEKMWITNAGFADLFVVFAKLDGEKFSAFIVERTFPGFSVGTEEKKMGIRGSSTCPLILNDCKVPAENLLGEIGKGHVIAFNILNLGRFKLGAGCVGGARNSLAAAIGYAKQRKAFGKSIAEFGLIKEKIASMAVGIYTGEALIYRTVGMIDAALAEIEKHGRTAADVSRDVRKGIEEYAVECSIIKVWASAMLDHVVDEVMQVFAGYGFVADYPLERQYRDSRINRIFEGTNEINRMITSGWVLKQAASGKLPLLPAIKKLMDEVMAGPSSGEPLEGALAAERTMVANAKKLTLFAAGAASQKFMMALPDQQEIMGALADMLIEVYAMETVTLRTQKMTAAQGENGSALALAMTQLYLAEAFPRVENAARKVIAAVAEGDMLRTQLAILRRLAKYEPANMVELGRKIAERTLEAGKYVTA